MKELLSTYIASKIDNVSIFCPSKKLSSVPRNICSIKNKISYNAISYEYQAKKCQQTSSDPYIEQKCLQLVCVIYSGREGRSDRSQRLEGRLQERVKYPPNKMLGSPMNAPTLGPHQLPSLKESGLMVLFAQFFNGTVVRSFLSCFYFSLGKAVCQKKPEIKNLERQSLYAPYLQCSKFTKKCHFLENI